MNVANGLFFLLFVIMVFGVIGVLVWLAEKAGRYPKTAMTGFFIIIATIVFLIGAYA